MRFSVRTVATYGAVSALSALVLGGCVVGGQGSVRPNGTITVQPSAQATVYAQPTATTTAYVAPNAPQPVYAQPAATTTVYTSQPGGVYAAPAAVGFVPVTAGWQSNGYNENDYVSYHMSLRARQFAAGYFPITQLFRGQMYQGQRQYVTVDAQPGRCYRIIGVGGAGVRDLDLRLLDQNGNVIDQDVATDNFPVLGLQRNLCLNWQGSFRVEVIMYSGGGDFGIQAFATQ